MAPEHLRPQDPAQLGPHILLGRLGAGGMGQVYLGRSPGGRQLAIKVIRDDFADAAPDALERFRREVETVRAVHGAYTANLVDASLDAPPYWLATEYVPGPTLLQAVRRHGPLPPDTCLRLFAALAEALASVHAYGVLHRDLKPHNVILSPVGPKLIDFGIARGLEQSALTHTGMVPGTPGFLAPEVLIRNEAGEAADVFALGATMAYAATGRAPYGEGQAHGVSYRVVHEDIDLAGAASGPAELIRACVAKEPGERPGLAEVIRRCAVTTALVEDPQYGALAAPAGPDEAVPAGFGPPVSRTVSGAPQAHPATYVPTVAAQQGASTAQVPAGGRRRRGWIGAAAGAAVAVAVLAGLGIWLLPLDDESGGKDQAGKDPTGKGEKSAAPKSPAGDKPSADPGGAPANIRELNPHQEWWQPPGPGESDGRCFTDGFAEQAKGFLHEAPRQPVQATAASVKVGWAANYRAVEMEKDKPYYVVAAVRPPHDIDPSTGRPNELESQNRSLSYVSKPMDLFDSAEKADEVTYPEDFRNPLPHADAKIKELPGGPIPLRNDPGAWSVLFFHVKSPTDYRLIACDGFEVK
ncbi:serine/threonine-protein kinase [Streptomyces boninensis]|uniref:serine/threonine-protein kinase n=1 Tax=Streptomyces boninensis TaxID=2039455 RepID=UPI003B22055E